MNQPNKYRRRFGIFPLFFLIATLILGGAVMFLWNAILPELTGVSPVKYWQAVGLLILCRILLGNFGGRIRQSRNWQGNQGDETDKSETAFSSNRPWGGKWMSMTEEERQQFKNEMRRRCGKPPKG